MIDYPNHASRLSVPLHLTGFLLLCLCLMVTGKNLAGEEIDPEEDDYPPGLLATYQVGEKRIQRIDPDIAFNWGKQAPLPQLSADKFSAEWTSLILVKQPGKYQISAYIEGEIKVEIDGETVLEGKRDTPGWIVSPKYDQNFGEFELQVTYQKISSQARVQLFWSSNLFGLEPIQANLLYREEGNPEVAQISRGRTHFDAHRCNRCHQRDHQLTSPAAPDLTSVTTALNPEWLIRKIQNDDSVSAHAKMPFFGFNQQEAEAVAAYLSAHSKTAKLQKIPGPKKDKKTKKVPTRDEERRSGEILMRSVGCLACHTIDGKGNQQPFSGGDLSSVGEKRNTRWFYTWLSDPQKLNKDHRMPVIKLSSTERRQLAYALSELKQTKIPVGKKQTTKKKLIADGKKLIAQARCTACHTIPGIDKPTQTVVDLSKPVQNWDNSCLAETPDLAIGRPAYRTIDREAVEAYLKSSYGKLAAENEFDRGRYVLEQRNCIYCHERDKHEGITQIAGQMAKFDPALAGQSEAMIPPALTAVGDKLKREALSEAVSGEQKTIRMPWLHVRMPRFQHTKADKEALLDYLVSHDRVPDDGPRQPDFMIDSSDQNRAQLLIAGQTITGAKGFSCISCHVLGDYKPRNVALGTRGSDLLMLGKRMRKEYFLRWVHNPLRIVPGMEMPALKKSVPKVLGGDINRQLDAIWLGLNDPQFKVPTNPSVVEQFLTVAAGEPARIVRDVFTNPKETGGGYVARAFAIGFDNGHNLLIDLDRFSLVQWTLGDLARQRTEGKSWYWDMAGSPIVSGYERGNDFALVKSGKEPMSVIYPYLQNGLAGALRSYHSDGNQITLNYELTFKVNDQKITVEISDTYKTLPEQQNQSGWQRTIKVSHLPEGYELYVGRIRFSKSIGNPQISVVKNPQAKWMHISDNNSHEYVKMNRDSAGHESLTLEYLCNLKADALQVKTKPKPKLALEKVTSAPGFDGVRLPLDRSIMPTAFAWLDDGTLAFTSLKGDVFLAKDTDGDGVEDQMILFEEGLSAPFGIVTDGTDLIVSHKPEVLRLSDTNGDGRADRRSVIATGWGLNDNYHDWATGCIRDSEGNLYIGLGSDYSQMQRPDDQIRWRGKILKISYNGDIEPLGHAFRYPIGLGINSKDEIFVSDQQGVQNTFNEINFLIPGKAYGVPSQSDLRAKQNLKETRAAIQVPHPWTRSVNGLTCIPKQFPNPALFDQGLGCEYNHRLLIRFTTQKVGDSLQGATYYFTRADVPPDEKNFTGPMSVAVSPKGDIYVGSIHDSGWLGGQNTGSITKLTPNGKFPNGIKELRATSDGFELEFFKPIDAKKASNKDAYTIAGYTRVWSGSYASPDSGRYKVKVEEVTVSDDQKTVRLKVNELKEKFVYEVSCKQIGQQGTKLFPVTGHYSMNRIPER
ncbi:c-type cytochrome [Gimesia aquarii]|uniref:Cytochrome c n=1 Tax=Gimesia aquarii TaxID=2527964 RepID=A0A517WRK5_9PLAN|nr:c-type cytochrome [Gimesia aquarii]QDU07891.1 Cytochrome c [Gimesia aquarii]